jgi:hypothetical protein
LLISFQRLSGDWRRLRGQPQGRRHLLLAMAYDRPTRLGQLVGKAPISSAGGAARAGQVGTTVGSDNEQGGYLAGRHLIERGRKAIAFLGTVGDDAPSSSGAGPVISEPWRKTA